MRSAKTIVAILAALNLAACEKPYLKQIDTVTRLDSSRISDKKLAQIDLLDQPTESSPYLKVRVLEEVKGPQFIGVAHIPGVRRLFLDEGYHVTQEES